jgi:hypothetical protein
VSSTDEGTHSTSFRARNLEQREVGDALVPVRERMVTSQARAEDGGFVDHVRVWLDSAETCGGRVQRGVGETDARPAGNRLGGDAETASAISR